MKMHIRQVQSAILILITATACAQAARVKEIATVEGVFTNQLRGYGLVTGLNGTGDSTSAKFTPTTIANMLAEDGITVDPSALKVKNVAAVIVTAELPPFAKPGSKMDVTISSIGDAKSLEGGVLLQTVLKAANGKSYAMAQGQLTIGSYSAGGGGNSQTKNHPTVGRVPSGALITQETITELTVNNKVNITLNQNDFTTASRMATAIDEKLGGHFAKAQDGNVISISVPEEYKDNLVNLIADLESVNVQIDSVAKVIVNERTGMIVMGDQVRISPCGIGTGTLTVTISSETAVSQPPALSGGNTAATTNTTVKVDEGKGPLVELKSGSTIGELLRALNALKATPRDIISILQLLKQAGALQAPLEVM